jgi:hypothetical protein
MVLRLSEYFLKKKTFFIKIKWVFILMLLVLDLVLTDNLIY